MDVGKLLERIKAQNQIIIRQNEKLLLLLAARNNEKDAELLAELQKLNRRIASGPLGVKGPKGPRQRED